MAGDAASCPRWILPLKLPYTPRGTVLSPPGAVRDTPQVGEIPRSFLGWLQDQPATSQGLPVASDIKATNALLSLPIA